MLEKASPWERSMVVLGLVGEKGSGKGTFAATFTTLIAPRSVTTIRFSDVLRETLDLWGITKTREHLQDLAAIMVDRYGPGTLARAVEARIAETDSDFVIVDGMRWRADLDLVRRLPRHHLLYITAPPDVRYRRLSQRSENVAEMGMTYAQFLEEEQEINEVDIPEIGAQADIRIENTGSLEDFRDHVREIMHMVASGR